MPFAEMDRLFDSMMRQAPASPAMPLDLYREGDKFCAKVDLPGVDPASIDIDIEDRTLTIRAERKTDVGDDVEWLSHERPTGTFARQLTLGYGLALDQVTANYDDGVLTVIVPVAEDQRSRKIAVTSSGKAPASVES